MNSFSFPTTLNRLSLRFAMPVYNFLLHEQCKLSNYQYSLLKKNVNELS